MSFPAADALIDGVELGEEELEAGAGAADVAMGAGLQPAAAIERPTIIPAAMMMRCMVFLSVDGVLTSHFVLRRGSGCTSRRTRGG
jgi:tetrahydromethanopterin S-methyltransferase subunit D